MPSSGPTSGASAACSEPSASSSLSLLSLRCTLHRLTRTDARQQMDLAHDPAVQPGRARSRPLRAVARRPRRPRLRPLRHRRKALPARHDRPATVRPRPARALQSPQESGARAGQERQRARVRVRMRADHVLVAARARSAPLRVPQVDHPGFGASPLFALWKTSRLTCRPPIPARVRAVPARESIDRPDRHFRSGRGSSGHQLGPRGDSEEPHLDRSVRSARREGEHDPFLWRQAPDFFTLKRSLIEMCARRSGRLWPRLCALFGDPPVGRHLHRVRDRPVAPRLPVDRARLRGLAFHSADLAPEQSLDEDVRVG